jgi:hypothetical protein
MNIDYYDEIHPQPGAVEGELVPNGLPNEDVTRPDWPTLPGTAAVNFANDEKLGPVLIEVSQRKHYRVWGEPAWDIGRYWTHEALEKQDDFYGRAAVRLSWNSGQYFAIMKNGGLITRIKGWSGTTARQPAEDVHKNLLPGYHLPGGIVQYFIPDGSLPWIDDKPTHWSRPAVESGQSIPRPLLQVSPPAKGDVAVVAQYQALAKQVYHLARLLEAASKEGAGLGLRTMPLTGPARILDANARELSAHGLYVLSDAAAKAQSKLIAQSLVPIARYIDGDIAWSSYGSEISHAIAEVVRWAYAIGVEAA